MAYQWYIVHVVSGHEKKVAKAIEEQARKKNLQELIARVVVPTTGMSYNPSKIAHQELIK